MKMESDESLNSSGQQLFHLRRIGPQPTKTGVSNIMDFREISYIIGRSPVQADFIIDSDVYMQGISISRCHARVIRQPGNQHRLFDDSLNGIFVNNIKIRGSCVLEEGDKVTFGHPTGSKLHPGTWLKQPNSEHQFVFEKCFCTNRNKETNDKKKTIQECPSYGEGTSEENIRGRKDQNDPKIDNSFEVNAECILKDLVEIKNLLNNVIRRKGCSTSSAGSMRESISETKEDTSSPVKEDIISACINFEVQTINDQDDTESPSSGKLLGKRSSPVRDKVACHSSPHKDACAQTDSDAWQKKTPAKNIAVQTKNAQNSEKSNKDGERPDPLKDSETDLQYSKDRSELIIFEGNNKEATESSDVKTDSVNINHMIKNHLNHQFERTISLESPNKSVLQCYESKSNLTNSHGSSEEVIKSSDCKTDRTDDSGTCCESQLERTSEENIQSKNDEKGDDYNDHGKDREDIKRTNRIQVSETENHQSHDLKEHPIEVEEYSSQNEEIDFEIFNIKDKLNQLDEMIHNSCLSPLEQIHSNKLADDYFSINENEGSIYYEASTHSNCIQEQSPLLFEDATEMSTAEKKSSRENGDKISRISEREKLLVEKIEGVETNDMSSSQENVLKNLFVDNSSIAKNKDSIEQNDLINGSKLQHIVVCENGDKNSEEIEMPRLGRSRSEEFDYKPGVNENKIGCDCDIDDSNLKIESDDNLETESVESNEDLPTSAFKDHVLDNWSPELKVVRNEIKSEKNQLGNIVEKQLDDVKIGKSTNITPLEESSLKNCSEMDITEDEALTTENMCGMKRKFSDTSLDVPAQTKIRIKEQTSYEPNEVRSSPEGSQNGFSNLKSIFKNIVSKFFKLPKKRRQSYSLAAPSQGPVYLEDKEGNYRKFVLNVPETPARDKQESCCQKWQSNEHYVLIYDRKAQLKHRQNTSTIDNLYINTDNENATGPVGLEIDKSTEDSESSIHKIDNAMIPGCQKSINKQNDVRKREECFGNEIQSPEHLSGLHDNNEKSLLCNLSEEKNDSESLDSESDDDDIMNTQWQNDSCSDHLNISEQNKITLNSDHEIDRDVPITEVADVDIESVYHGDSCKDSKINSSSIVSNSQCVSLSFDCNVGYNSTASNSIHGRNTVLNEEEPSNAEQYDKGSFLDTFSSEVESKEATKVIDKLIEHDNEKSMSISTEVCYTSIAKEEDLPITASDTGQEILKINENENVIPCSEISRHKESLVKNKGQDYEKYKEQKLSNSDNFNTSYDNCSNVTDCNVGNNENDWKNINCCGDTEKNEMDLPVFKAIIINVDKSSDGNKTVIDSVQDNKKREELTSTNADVFASCDENTSYDNAIDSKNEEDTAESNNGCKANFVNTDLTINNVTDSHNNMAVEKATSWKHSENDEESEINCIVHENINPKHKKIKSRTKLHIQLTYRENQMDEQMNNSPVKAESNLNGGNEQDILDKISICACDVVKKEIDSFKVNEPESECASSIDDDDDDDNDLGDEPGSLVSFNQPTKLFPALNDVQKSDDETKSPIYIPNYYDVVKSSGGDELPVDQLSCSFSDNDDTCFPDLDLSILNETTEDEKEIVNNGNEPNRDICPKDISDKEDDADEDVAQNDAEFMKRKQSGAEYMDNEKCDADLFDNELNDAETIGDEQNVDVRNYKHNDAKVIDCEQKTFEEMKNEQSDDESVNDEHDDTEFMKNEHSDAEVVENEYIGAEVMQNVQSDAEVVESEYSDFEVMNNEQNGAEVVENEKSDGEAVQSEQSDAEVMESEHDDAEDMNNVQSDSEDLDNAQSDAEASNNEHRDVNNRDYENHEDDTDVEIENVSSERNETYNGPRNNIKTCYGHNPTQNGNAIRGSGIKRKIASNEFENKRLKSEQDKDLEERSVYETTNASSKLLEEEPPSLSRNDNIPLTQLISHSTLPDLDCFTATQVNTVSEKLERKVTSMSVEPETKQKARELLAKLKARRAVKQEINECKTEIDEPMGSTDITSNVPEDREESHGALQDIDSHVERCRCVISNLKQVLDSNQTLHRVQTWRNDLTRIEKKLDFPKTVIAVVGKTGDGKSSLLNALLDQKSVLPTSCMQACTSVVVEIVQNTTSDKFEADIQFLEEKEWFDEVRILLNDITGPDGKLRKNQPDQTSDAYASYSKIKAVYGKINTFEKLRRQMLVTRWLGKIKVVKSSTPEEFKKMVEKYIETQDRSTGHQFWPIVKHVRLRIPNCDVCSSGAALVDLPGIRDSNAARDKIAKEYMKDCTAIWVVSSIHRAIDDKTAKDLLGENFRRQLLMDGQYGSVTFICTKTDILAQSELIRPLNLEDKTLEHSSKIRQLEEERKDAEKTVKNLTRERNELQQSLKTMKEDADELKEQLEEIGSVLDPIELDKDDSEDFSALKEYQDELKSKEETIQQTQNKVEELDRFKTDASKRVLELENKISVHRKKISVICALARNRYSEERIKSDFRSGLKEMKRRAGISSNNNGDDDDDFEDMYQEDNDTSDNLKVFCCSSTEYQKIQNLLDEQPHVFTNAEDTQIPSLRGYVHQIARVRKTQALERLIRSLGGFVFDLNSYVRESKHEDSSRWKTNQSAIEGEVEKLFEALEPVIGELSSSITSMFDDNVKPKLDEGAAAAMEMANAICTKWGAKKPKDKENDKPSSYLPYSTYKAVVSRNGDYSSKTFGYINFNEDLSEPMYRCMTIAWDRAFSGTLWRILEDAKEKLVKKMIEFVEKLGATLYRLGMNKDRLRRVGAQFLGSAKNKLGDMVIHLKEQITNSQREISRLVNPHVQDSLTEPYYRSYCECGPGTYARMKDHMSKGIDHGRFKMFDEATKILMSRLMELQRGLINYTKTVCRSLVQDLRISLEPLWNESWTSNPFSVAISPVLNTVCSEMRAIYASAGIQNTEDHSDGLIDQETEPVSQSPSNTEQIIDSATAGYLSSSNPNQAGPSSGTNQLHCTGTTQSKATTDSQSNGSIIISQSNRGILNQSVNYSTNQSNITNNDSQTNHSRDFPLIKSANNFSSIHGALNVDEASSSGQSTFVIGEPHHKSMPKSLPLQQRSQTGSIGVFNDFTNCQVKQEPGPSNSMRFPNPFVEDQRVHSIRTSQKTRKNADKRVLFESTNIKISQSKDPARKKLSNFQMSSMVPLSQSSVEVKQEPVITGYESHEQVIDLGVIDLTEED